MNHCAQAVTSFREQLRKLGIDLQDLNRPEVQRSYSEIARRLRRGRYKCIGLAPADDKVGVPAVAVHLALALARVAGSPSAVVDVLGNWVSSGTRSPPANSRTGFVPTWLSEELLLLAPSIGDSARPLQLLESIIASHADQLQHLVVDLTGFDHSGEHVTAASLLDTVAVVAQTGRTTIPDIERWNSALPAAKNAGVLLVSD